MARDSNYSSLINRIQQRNLFLPMSILQHNVFQIAFHSPSICPMMRHSINKLHYISTHSLQIWKYYERCTNFQSTELFLLFTTLLLFIIGLEVLATSFAPLPSMIEPEYVYSTNVVLMSSSGNSPKERSRGSRLYISHLFVQSLDFSILNTSAYKEH